MLWPVKTYNIIYADPPWTYYVWTSKDKGRTASAHYETMSTENICALPVANITASDCILFLWTTCPNLPDALRVVNSWGFTYKTVAFVWVKTNRDGSPFMGLGHWSRANAELCLLATKGKPKRVNKAVNQIVFAPKREHSRKPDEVRKRIVELIGDLPRIELFAREKQSGWDVWGNEVNKFCDN